MIANIAARLHLPVAPDDIVALLDQDGETPSIIGSVCRLKLPASFTFAALATPVLARIRPLSSGGAEAEASSRHGRKARPRGPAQLGHALGRRYFFKRSASITLASG
jgi:hypothetical protein